MAVNGFVWGKNPDRRPSTLAQSPISWGGMVSLLRYGFLTTFPSYFSLLVKDGRGIRVTEGRRSRLASGLGFPQPLFSCRPRCRFILGPNSRTRCAQNPRPCTTLPGQTHRPLPWRSLPSLGSSAGGFTRPRQFLLRSLHAPVSLRRSSRPGDLRHFFFPRPH